MVIISLQDGRGMGQHAERVQLLAHARREGV
jgi:hypothetical protein